MDKNAIKKYAVWARNELIARVSQKAQQYGITAGGYGDKNADSVNGVLLSATEKKQRQALIAKIDAEGFEQVMEEVAYTWFNRFTALRFMEVNNYLPSHTRVFTNEANEFKPQILADAISLEFEELDMDKVFKLKNDNKDEELYKYLLIIQCNALSSILPGMFQKIADYTELLLPDYLLREGSILDKLVKEIKEENFNISSEDGKLEIIGWLYQYYISEKHEAVVDPLHGKIVKKDEVPAATQLFTTEWVVRYLIDNSVGRYWIERNPNSDLGASLEFLSTGKDGKIEPVNESIKPQDVTVFDPCVGSGHFSLYAFDVLMKIYVEFGYSERDAAAEIVKNNIFGLDIDGRAAQLAYFAIMMKARQYDRRFLTRGIQPNIYEIKESNSIDSASIDYFCNNDDSLRKNINAVMALLKDAKEYGSILQIPEIDFDVLQTRLEECKFATSIFDVFVNNEICELVLVAKTLSTKYAVVATNPPYLNKYDDKLRKYISEFYKDYSGDIFSVFIYRNFGYCKPNGYSGFMTPFVWMFIKTYEKLRDYIISCKHLVSLIQMEYSAYEEATVPICSFILKNGKSSEASICFKLSDFRGGMEVQREKVLEALADKSCTYFYEAHQSNFCKIQGQPIAYWMSDNVFEICDREKVFEDYATTRAGMITGNNNMFMRMWHEIDYTKMGIRLRSRESAVDSKKKWFPYNKGGEYRKWYGNNEYVVNWENDGFFMRNFKDDKGKIPAHAFNLEYIFKENVTWSSLSSYKFAARYTDYGFLYDASGSFADVRTENLYYTLAFLCSAVTMYFLSAMNPTLNFQKGNIASLPFILNKEKIDAIDALTREAISLSKKDWDAFETSWDFISHPLIQGESIEAAYNEWEKECNDRFDKLKENEEEINKLFIEIYGMCGELSPSVDDRDVTVRLADKEREIKSFISYAVGCMFGRYVIGKNGIQYAGGKWNSDDIGSKMMDADNIIPICDDEYFEDDIVSKFVKFVELVYGKANLEENLLFISNVLGGNGAPRDVIRNYFINDFYADHIKIYQKRPIYWLFDSGKKNGFKCLVYMHRYQPDTIARIRTDYVHEQQSRYRTALADLEQRINSASTSERVKLNKRLKTIQDQAEELRKYEEKIHHLADQMISIDLDDGVKENYAKFQDVLAKIK